MSPTSVCPPRRQSVVRRDRGGAGRGLAGLPNGLTLRIMPATRVFVAHPLAKPQKPALDSPLGLARRAFHFRLRYFRGEQGEHGEQYAVSLISQ
jgi:hypothetical protein